MGEPQAVQGTRQGWACKACDGCAAAACQLYPANSTSHLVDVGMGDVGIHVVLAVALPQRLLHCSGAGWAAPW